MTGLSTPRGKEALPVTRQSIETSAAEILLAKNPLLTHRVQEMLLNSVESTLTNATEGFECASSLLPNQAAHIPRDVG